METAAGAPWHILVVDDEENLNWSLVHSLRKEGYTADGAATGIEAQRRLSEQRYDCVISDVMMPGMDGFELLQWIRRHQPSARVIMMTAFGSPTTRQEALNNGVVAYLEKPFDLHALKDELTKMRGAGGSARSARGDEYDLLEVAQVINLARRDISLAVRLAGETGHLQFVQGELIWAELGALRGDEAVIALGAAKTIAMEPEARDAHGQRNVTQPLSRLTYLALARRDGRAQPANISLRPGNEQAPEAPEAPEAPADTSGTATVAGADPDASDAPGHALAAERIRAVLDALAADLPSPCGVALLRSDGSLLSKQWVGGEEQPASLFTHLGQSALAASRALLVGDLGSMEELHLFTSEWLVRVRRVGLGDRALLLVALVQRAVDITSVTAALDERAPALANAIN